MSTISKPWVEKYRPGTLDDIVHHDEIVSVLKRSLVNNDFPNFLLYGPPGTGKTSSILALARSMFGSEVSQRVLHLNASDDRGIAVIRERVRKFALTVPMNSKNIVRLKLVILDEADSMTSAAQACLRRTMEIYSKTTRFCLICNYVSRIIEPIASRCSQFRFQSITTPIMQERLNKICENEGVKCSDPGVIEQLISVCDGDLRQAITILQSAHRLAGPNNKIDNDLIQEVCGLIPRRYINKFIATCRSKNLQRLEDCITELVNEGYTASQFLSQVHDWLLNQSTLSDASLAKVLPALALAEHRFCDGSDEFIQLMYVASVITKNFEASNLSQ